jgi:peptidyl-prolyl cis-trans isomerase B (cyclophilin B)
VIDLNARLVVPLLVGAAALTGCGKSDEDKIKNVLQDYNAALVDGDGKKACSLFDAEGQRRLVNSLKSLAPTSSATDCAQLIRDVSATITDDNGKRIKALKITNVKVNGDKATAQSGVLTTLVKKDGDWKVTNFAGSSAQAPQDRPVPKGCTRVSPPKPKEQGQRTAPKARLGASNPPSIHIRTNCGSFTFRLDPKASPNAAASVYALVASKFYDNTVFHRIVPGFVIQGGDPTGTGGGGAGYSTVDQPAIKTNYTRGTVAMAKGGQEAPGTASSQFFVVTGKKADLPPDYAVIGHVTQGSDVVERIGRLGDAQERPTFLVVLQRATVER